MLKKYNKYDSILMPLNPTDHSYLSFEKLMLPVAVDRGIGIQAMKSTANAGLLSEVHLKACLWYVICPPIQCLAVGCTTIGHFEADVWIAQQFKPLAEQEIARIRAAAERLAGPRLEGWKRDTQQRVSAYRYRDGEQG